MLARRQLRADVVIDLARAHPAGVATADDHSLLSPRDRRLIALETHPDQLVAKPERINDLGRRGQQRHHAHDAERRSQATRSPQHPPAKTPVADPAAQQHARRGVHPLISDDRKSQPSEQPCPTRQVVRTVLAPDAGGRSDDGAMTPRTDRHGRRMGRGEMKEPHPAPAVAVGFTRRTPRTRRWSCSSLESGWWG
jgi:hypothetical protein